MLQISRVLESFQQPSRLRDLPTILSCRPSPLARTGHHSCWRVRLSFLKPAGSAWGPALRVSAARRRFGRDDSSGAMATPPASPCAMQAQLFPIRIPGRSDARSAIPSPGSTSPQLRSDADALARSHVQPQARDSGSAAWCCRLTASDGNAGQRWLGRASFRARSTQTPNASTRQVDICRPRH